MSKLTIVTQPAARTTVVQRPAPVVAVLAVKQGPSGPQGDPGVAGISTDPDNRAKLGTDSQVFVPELLVDPVAYYILAKAP